MKIIILFVLAGLSLAADFKCVKEPMENKGCVLYAMENAADGLKTLADFLCKYQSNIDNDPNYETTGRKFIETMACAGCSIDKLIGTNRTLEEILADAGQTKEAIIKTLIKAGEALQLSKPVINLMCKLTSSALLSQCLSNNLKANVPQLLKTLCMANVPQLLKTLCMDVNSLSAEQLMTILKNLSCFADDAVGTDGTFRELFQKTGEGMKFLLRPIVQVLKNELISQGIINDEVCSLTSGSGGSTAVGNIVGSLFGS